MSDKPKGPQSLDDEALDDVHGGLQVKPAGEDFEFTPETFDAVNKDFIRDEYKTNSYLYLSNDKPGTPDGSTASPTKKKSS